MVDVVEGIKTPLGAFILLIIVGVLASLTIAASISGALTGAMVSAAGFSAVLLILAMIKILGK